MAETDITNYMVRISNCLQTILDLEPELERLELGHSLLDEFVVLKSFLEKIDRVEVGEEDVRRIEQATANFLEELKGPLAGLDAEENGNRRLQ
ncbi:hypothetical protein [Salidesulfovibrio onnuriiensis]|uniref:hypothetical protein n=1 Tax=Salidesulfovibrio onnuriiensis TaxID=2583823 RepID=UPI0011CCC3DB|nr:hypothetical protein [Salidesulfovibrio onnuriiensis]